jgi:DNA-directed RNA polymerase specialized sigma24 family protein
MSAFWRRRRRQPREVDLAEDNPEVRAALESLPCALADRPEAALHRRELARLVQITLDHLPHHYGNALEWKYIEGDSIREIATKLKIGRKAAESLLTRARQAFRNEFAALSAGPAEGSPGR